MPRAVAIAVFRVKSPHFFACMGPIRCRLMKASNSLAPGRAAVRNVTPETA